MHDITHVLSNEILLADHANILKEIKYLPDCTKLLQELDKVHIWIENYYLNPNIEKSAIVSFVRCVNYEMRDLGVTFDSHMDEICDYVLRFSAYKKKCTIFKLHNIIDIWNTGYINTELWINTLVTVCVCRL